MFDNLIESRRTLSGRAILTQGTPSVIFHVVLIAFGVYATAHAGQAVEERIHVFTVRMRAPEPPKNEPPPPEQVATVNPPPKGFQTLAIPVNIPVDIPPPSQSNFNAADFSGVGVEGGVARGVEGGTGPVISDQPYLEAVVEERPDLIQNTCGMMRYPDMLRQAGVEGRVMVEVVLDTLGRAERGSLRILQSSHQLFDQSAKEMVVACRYRPGRIQGRAVRVRVQVPVVFSITH